MSYPQDVMEEVEPRLPPEVEHIIFTMAFDPFDLKFSITLSFVAKRVNAWIRPLIYRVVDQVSQISTPNFSRDGCPSIKQIGPLVQHLVLGRTQKTHTDMERMIDPCPNLISLTCWYSFKIKYILQSLVSLKNLRALSGDLSDIREEDLCTPAFLQLTHLEILGDSDSGPMMYILPSYFSKSQVTHLRLYEVEDFEGYPIQDILDMCPRLRVLILTVPWDVTDNQNDFNLDSDIVAVCETDLRLVVLETNLCNTEDWIMGARGFYDSWTFAEQVVTARQNDYLKEGDRRLFFTSFDLYNDLNEKGREWYCEDQKQHAIYPSPSLRTVIT